MIDAIRIATKHGNSFSDPRAASKLSTVKSGGKPGWRQGMHWRTHAREMGTLQALGGERLCLTGPSFVWAGPAASDGGTQRRNPTADRNCETSFPGQPLVWLVSSACSPPARGRSGGVDRQGVQAGRRTRPLSASLTARCRATRERRGQCRRPDPHRIMCFPARGCASMPMVKMAFVHYIKGCWGKRRRSARHEFASRGLSILVALTNASQDQNHVVQPKTICAIIASSLSTSASTLRVGAERRPGDTRVATLRA